MQYVTYCTVRTEYLVCIQSLPGHHVHIRQLRHGPCVMRFPTPDSEGPKFSSSFNRSTASSHPLPVPSLQCFSSHTSSASSYSLNDENSRPPYTSINLAAPATIQSDHLRHDNGLTSDAPADGSKNCTWTMGSVPTSVESNLPASAVRQFLLHFLF